MTPLRVGIYDTSFRGVDPSITHGQTLPPTFEYVDFPSTAAAVAACDVLLATWGMDAAVPPHPRRVLWLQENREFRPHPPGAVLDSFDLVITNDTVLAEAQPDHVRYLPLLGTWFSAAEAGPDVPALAKSRNVSMIANTKSLSSGHRVRHDIAAAVPPGPDTYDGYGRLFGGVYLPSKLPALAPYRFSIVIEPSAYRWFFSEKLGDAFAARTVPLYWACRDMAPLAALGFDTSGILPWGTPSGLRDVLATIARHGEEMYADMAAAIESNYQRIWQIPTTEHMLEPLLREYFGL